MISKLLVANRGEIAIRAFRAAYEMGIATVAVYPYEDRNSLHRLKADESYQIGEIGHPVRAYLSVDEIIRVAKHSGADAIYPGYGFLSENPELASACAEAGITFVGPSAHVLELTGNKSRAIDAARAAGLPVLASSAPSSSVDELVAAAADMEFPLFVKAVSGGGGRGMRRVTDPEALAEAVEAASREAESAFGDPAVYLEQAVINPRHIEVQILADTQGNVMHLFERDCSVQRRHQKVIELAPAPNLDPGLRERICADAVALARQIGYSCAGTIEFLLDERGHHVFIECNPRIQVEHTVTEEITDVDLVGSQLRIAAGESLADLGLSQDSLAIRGAAMQCRITTEDPANGFRPDTGRITAYRSPGGAGVRLDGGTNVGAEVLAHFDSMLVKLTCRGRDFSTAVSRARRALAEFRIRGVSTNIPFLQAVIEDPDFRAGRVNTSFIDDRPQLLTAHTPADRGTKILNYLADVTVNKPNGERPSAVYPQDKLPALDLSTVPPAGSKQRLVELGPEGFAAWMRDGKALGVTDTTFRDAHQSLLATRLRSTGLLKVAPYVARTMPQLLSIECWGGATYDVALRFLKEDPWERLAALREAVPNICLQMLLRGRNTVGYTPYPELVTSAFVQEATATGIDIFRIFDALNNIESMRPAIDAVRETGTAIAEVAMSYTGDLSDPAENLYTLDYYLKLAEQIVDAGAHVLAIKDMAGLLRPHSAHLLVSALRSRFDLPVHVHTHDTPGGQLATYLAAWQAGASAVDGAAAPLAGTTSQPALSSIVAAAAHTEYDTGLSLDAVCDLEPYWEALRKVYAPFESGLPAPTGRVYTHEIPGGQLSNLRQQAIALGLGDRFEEIETAYADADRVLGRLVKVTPSSKVVGDLALALVGAGVSAAEFAADPARYDIPDSVIGFLRGELGDPPGGWPEPLRTKALEGRGPARPVQELSVEDEALLAAPGPKRQAALNRLLFPGPTKEFEAHRETYGDTSSLSANQFFYGLRYGEEHRVELERGVQLLIGLEAISDPDERGMRTVMCILNGQLRPITVRDRSIASEIPAAEKADRNNPDHVAAPFAGVVTVGVAAGDTVEAGATIATIEAMKMEAAITAPRAGTVERVAVAATAQVEGGDLLVVVTGSAGKGEAAGGSN
ncbi:pyruvate carboxylase [Mycolicibacterium fortuitum]|uniref:Pyruvate carboxylase n=1 Tax=Mycolicibacterium fortuitum subsp. fortuitum DSM 46621 = ATCC 6841 = JCM 6387 TaxID=1214102 RepID=K0UK72_MYCFO|nr:pyruvate carboxylase [Mycolicibacterium fortuitum]AIY46108.1 Pyruvate carboxylase [Mycobacterium sp. VKM Ac-1817D]CRL81652.1 pyruvate carboxylase [Mycolicibacter nonchromogenicus]EJZ07582.1 pyruvate carboxylase [Mycolicibacterium fortuitum subsp. fortuitum DSM 46621 = ATCC 6841 = JCM 6387]WEV34987.1 pyruvate carboxylase [Mycolicibacterium fortuitum]CRL55403.1 pyruvate carboxylase [Mycolicibacterium fortuitum subsp. fortuitum DSM 46621 = ATCC 6841 = JCM 6387]